MTSEPVVVQVSSAATAYLQLPGGWFLNNAGWIVGDERTLLVDTCATEARSRRLLAAARAAGLPNAPLSAVLTHGHGDHANGAGVVAREGGSVLASPAAARDIATGPHTYPAVFHCSTWGDITPPDISTTIAESTSLDLGGVSVEILPVPGRAHTDGDLVVRLPHDDVLFTGDLLFSEVTPLALHGSITGWLDALDWLAGFDAAHIVPGHGPLATRDSGALAAVQDYLHWLLDAVANTDHPDFDQLERQARSRWPHWHDAERHAVNLRVAHAEAHDRPCDFPTALEAMLHSAGGPIALDI